MTKKKFAKAIFNRKEQMLEVTCDKCGHYQKVDAIPVTGTIGQAIRGEKQTTTNWFGSAADFCDECNKGFNYEKWPPAEV
tara:strand:- start:2677 stop:2916 length:240 start_codon:yes stop_codon:yes gene_type:complete